MQIPKRGKTKGGCKMTYSAKRLDKSNMDKIQQLEKKLDYCVVAWEKTPRVASLSDSQIEELKAVEKEMGAVIVAYDCK
jgi:hypothetical protein